MCADIKILKLKFSQDLKLEFGQYFAVDGRYFEPGFGKYLEF